MRSLQACKAARLRVMHIADDCLEASRDTRNFKAMTADVYIEEPEGFGLCVRVLLKTTAFNPTKEIRQVWSAETYLPLTMFFDYQYIYEHSQGFRIDLLKAHRESIYYRIMGTLIRLDSEVKLNLTKN